MKPRRGEAALRYSSSLICRVLCTFTLRKLRAERSVHGVGKRRDHPDRRRGTAALALRPALNAHQALPLSCYTLFRSVQLCGWLQAT